MKLIYLSPVSWDSFSQRPHELVAYFHLRTGGKVLWIEPYPTRLPALSDVFVNGQNTGKADIAKPDWLDVIRPRALPIEPLPFSDNVHGIMWTDMLSLINDFIDDSTFLGIGKPSALAIKLLTEMRFAWTFYDAMDDFPAFYRGLSKRSMTKMVRDASNKVTTILTSSTSLHDRLSEKLVDVRLVLNACATQRLPEIDLVHKIHVHPGPVIGYVGTIARWFDWVIVEKLALSNPHALIRLIGPVHVRVPRSLPKNVSVESMLPHAEALQVMLQFDIGLIPFKLTPLTSSVDPIKYYEYRALGLPVISSAFGEMVRRSGDCGVYLIDETSNLKNVVIEALSCQTSSEMIDRFRKENSWESRFDHANIVNY